MDSFDHDETYRYGYSQACLTFLENALATVPADARVLIFSHLPPAARLQFWAKAIRGNNEMAAILKKYAGKVIAFVNGHNHADHIDNEMGVPVVSINNAKCESFTEKKPEGYITPARALGNATQECFDILLVNAAHNQARFIRFGAGDDRRVVGGYAQYVQKMISIILPVYNIEAYVARCVDSLLAQTYKHIEIILVNDGSTDNSGAICDEYAKTDPRVVVIHQANKGVSAARNAGLDIARGDWVGFVDGDDYVEPTMYRTLLSQARTSGKKIVVCGYEVNSPKKSRPVVHKKLSKTVSREKALSYAIRQTYLEGQVWNMLFNRDLLEADPPIRYDEAVHSAEDRLFGISVLARSDGFAYVPKALYHQWQHPGGVADGFSARRMTLTLAYERIHEVMAQHHAPLVKKATYNYMDVSVYLINRAVRNQQYQHLPALKKHARRYALRYFISRELSIAKKLRNFAVTFFPRTTNKIWAFLKRRTGLKNLIAKLNKR